jgi:type III pantothenate kinase
MKALVIDAGNTRIKVATFNKSTLLATKHFSINQLNECLSELSEQVVDYAILSSVLADDQTLLIKQAVQIPLVILDAQTPVPIQIDYDSKATLGKDRLANAVAIHTLTNKDALAIDLGTCIKFDFVSKNGIYLGGSISPGLQMRYKAMHDYTGKLPLIKNSYPTKLIGDSTVNSMMSGVMNGIKYEIEGMIQAYQQEYKDLVIFVTGGGAKAIEINTTSTLFYDEDLTINGLYKILHYQHAY